MSQRQISRSPDLRRLRDEGYEVAIQANHLLVGHVPYVNGAGEVRYGTLVSELTLSGDVTGRPSTHVVHFAGERPCDHAGRPLTKLILDGQPAHPVTEALVAAWMFSHKPTPAGAYADYYEKMTTYAAILTSQANVLDPAATPRTYRPVADDEDDAVFCYLDTASSRAGIGVLTEKLRVPKVAIVGLGGTGSYILDYLAKTPIGEIHLFDGDLYLQHNAFRAPGAASVEMLAAQPTKAEHWQSTYAAMRRGIVAHPYRLDQDNVAELQEMSFVFLAVDDGPAKKTIVDALEEYRVPFVDVGMGLYEVDGALAGLLRTSLSAGSEPERAAARERISFGQGAGDGMYGRNIQVAELNALNAALAVIAWKKHVGFYNDLERERFSVYALDTNTIVNEDQT